MGTKLGAAGINIIAAALSQDTEGTGAILILRVDGEVPEALVDEIASELGASAIQLELG